MSNHDQTQNFNKPALYSAVLIFFVSLVVLLFAAGIKGATSTPEQQLPTSVATQSIQIQNGFVTPINIIGQIESPQAADMAFDNSGEILAVYVEEGDSVVKGQTLAALETRRIDAQRSELEASLAQAEAELKLALISQTRTNNMVSQSLSSKQAKDEADTRVDAAQAQVNGIKASLVRLDVETEKSKITAPFNGNVSTRYLDEGAVVNPGVPVLRMTSNNRLYARFAVSMESLSSYGVGSSVLLRNREGTVRGDVLQQLPIRDALTRSVDILVVLEENPALIPGDIITLTGEKAHSESGTWIPTSALSNGVRGLWRLFVVNLEQGNKVEARAVEVLYTDGQNAFVRGAIDNNLVYVTQGTHKLAPGQLVSVKQDTSELGAQR